MRSRSTWSCKIRVPICLVGQHEVSATATFRPADARARSEP
jgi:hypothetical protein